MLVNQSNIDAIFINFKTIFNKAFEDYSDEWKATAMLTQSITAKEKYVWLSKMPMLRKWFGDKQIDQIAAHDYSIENENYEVTVELDRDNVKDDSVGIYRPLVEMAGYAAKTHPNEIVDALKNNAFANTCFDGQYYYDTDHDVAGSSVSNKGTAALSAATTALATASLGAGIKAIAAFKSDEGRPLRLQADTLEIPPALLETGKILTSNAKLTDESPNPYNGMLKLLVNPGLTSTTAWFLHVTKFPIKPYIFQEREKAHFVQMTNPESENVFKRGKYLFGVEARGAGGYGFWQLSYGSTGDA